MAETLGDCNGLLLRAHGIVLVSESIESLLIDSIHFDRNAQAQLEATRLGEPIPMSDEEFDIFEQRFDRPKHGIKLWHYYSTRAMERGVLPTEWSNII
jgi:ribulose-5-phosphate 4-epimerase/fuculose-1-phosphate aldolase